MSNPFVVGAKGDNVLCRINKSLNRTITENKVSDSRMWEMCMALSNALHNRNVWMWIDKQAGIRLYGRFATGCVKKCTNGHRAIVPVPAKHGVHLDGRGVYVDGLHLDVETYAHSMSELGVNNTTLRPSDAAVVPGGNTMSYTFDSLDTEVLFEYIARRVPEGASSHFVDSYDRQHYTVERITSERRRELVNLIRVRKFCNSPSPFGHFFQAECAPPRPHGPPIETNEFEGGIVLQVALTSTTLPIDRLLRVPDGFCADSADKKLLAGDTLQRMQCYRDSARPAPHGVCDWPWK